MRTVKLTDSQRERFAKARAAGKLISRTLRLVGRTDRGIVYECASCGEEHEAVSSEPGFCPYCSAAK